YYFAKDATERATQTGMRDPTSVAEAAAKVSERANQVMFYKIAQLLKQAASPSEVISRMRDWSMTDRWQSFVDKNGADIVRNASTIIDHFGKDTTYEKLTKGERMFTADYRSVDDFMKEMAPKIAASHFKAGLEKAGKSLLEKDDLIDEGTFAMPTTQLKMM